MAKAKSGGTRSYIRGRVGSDVYSIGKDAKGKKQQVVRSLAETVANPQTQKQMKGRMIMSTVMQVVAALKPIIDHSFDNVSGKQQNISEFISRNYGLIKTDVEQHASSGNVFGLSMYQEKGAKQGAYVVAMGSAEVPDALVLTKETGVIAITLPSDAITIGGLKQALGFSTEEYFTLVGIKTNGMAAYERFRVNPTMGNDVAISSSNISEIFAVEGNATGTISIASNVISISMSSIANCCAVIVSKVAANGYVHNNAQLGAGVDLANNANVALPTYPVGSADYLNGGDVLGLSEQYRNNGENAPSPTPVAVAAPTISGQTPFAESTTVSMTAAQGAQIRYTDDGTTPTSASTLYSAPITLTETKTIRAIAILDGVSSSVAAATFTKSGSGDDGGYDLGS